MASDAPSPHVDALVLVAGRDALTPSARRDDRDVVAVVPSIGSVAGDAAAGALALVRRADLLVPADRAVADALADLVPVEPWDMLVSAEPTATTVARALDRRRRAPHRPRRLALVTPLPPEPSGVAVYSARLAEALARRVELTCVTAVPPADVQAPAGVRVVGVATFEAEASAGRFDEIVHVLGNHPVHGTQLALLRRWPGAAELHDVRLIGAYAGLCAPGDALADELQRLEPGRFDPSLLREAELRMGPAVEAGVWMVREVAALATTVLVHSAHAAGLVAAETGVDALDVGPLACPPAGARHEPVDGDDALVVSVGVVDQSKRPDALVRALTAMPAGAWLAFVGPVGDGLRRELRRLAAELGVDTRLVMTGRVDDDAYAGWLRRAAVAVQLRSHSNGESSAAVADCLAHGVPTVVADAGSLAELPPAAAVRVPIDVTGLALGEVLGALLGDVEQRRSLQRAALAFAAANGFDAAADRLLTALFGPGRT